MFVLLTILYILALGKILCQVQVNQEVRYLPSPFQPRRGDLPRHFHRSTSSLQALQYSPQTTEKFNEERNINATTQKSTNANQLKRRLFISRVETRRMDQNRPFVNSATNNITNPKSAQGDTSIPRAQNNINSTSAQNNTDIYDKVVFKDDPPTDVNSVNFEEPARNGSLENTTKKTATEIPLPGNVTLEDRSSFDGDQCPTGYVRVNGMCVQPD